MDVCTCTWGAFFALLLVSTSASILFVRATYESKASQSDSQVAQELAKSRKEYYRAVSFLRPSSVVLDWAVLEDTALP